MAETLLMSLATEAGTSAAIASAGAAVGPVTAAASGMGTLSLIGSTAGALMTGLSFAGSIAQGNQQSAMYKIQQRQSELAARTERLRGAQQVSKIRENLRSTLASQNALFAGRGVVLADGSPADVAGKSMTEASRDIQIAQFGSDMQAGSLQSQGQQFAMEADAAETGGLMDAFSTAYKNRNSLRRGISAASSLVGA